MHTCSKANRCVYQNYLQLYKSDINVSEDSCLPHTDLPIISQSTDGNNAQKAKQDFGNTSTYAYNREKEEKNLKTKLKKII